MFTDIPSKPEGVRRALLIGVAKVKGFATISQAYTDVIRMRDFLVKSCGYPLENIVIMMHNKSVPPKLYPSKENMLREIDDIVRLTSQHDRIFFYYSGHGDQVRCRHNSEPDHKDEAILTYTGKRIIDNVLKEHLVDPLPQGAKLFALCDCCHSHTVLDLEHSNCNGLRKVPSGKRPSAEISKDSFEDKLSSMDDSQLSTADGVCFPAIRRAASPESDLPLCTFDCPMTPPENRVKAYVVSLSACRDNELAYDDNDTGGTVTKFFIEYLEGNPKPSYYDLLFNIQRKVDDITRKRTPRTNATGETSYFPPHLQKRSKNEVEIEDRCTCEHHHGHSDDRNDTLNSQELSYSSHYRLDMSQTVEL